MKIEIPLDKVGRGSIIYPTFSFDQSKSVSLFQITIFFSGGFAPQPPNHFPQPNLKLLMIEYTLNQ